MCRDVGVQGCGYEGWCVRLVMYGEVKMWRRQV